MSRAAEATKSLLQGWLLRGNFYWKLPRGARLALTFDDGPDPEHTPRILETLGRAGIKATFFVIGDRARQFPQVLRDVIAAGHTVGSHTQTHMEFPTATAGDLARELEEARRTIEDIGGVSVSLVRPPRGRLDVQSLYRVPELGYRIIHWSVTYSDYRRDGIEQLLGRMRGRQPRPRDIVLLHDTMPDTAGALAVMLPEWTSEGQQFAALDREALGTS